MDTRRSLRRERNEARKQHATRTEERDQAVKDAETERFNVKRLAGQLDEMRQDRDRLAAKLRPARGDQFDAWLRTQRDQHADGYTRDPEWEAVNRVLDLYRLHADTGTPLTEHVCEGRMAGDCGCMEAAS